MATELMNREETAVPVEVGFHTSSGFELLQRMAKLLAASALVPKEFQGNIPNVTIALEMAKRMNASPLAVMQNLYIVHGKPSWSSTFIIAAINSTDKFSPLRFRVTGTEDQDDRTCVAYAIEKATGEVLESPPISIKMAKAEGWYSRNGSKWQTMPDLMLRYRCATLFGRLYAPEVLMGMATVEEAIDITPPEPTPAGPSGGNGSRTEALLNKIKQEPVEITEAAAAPSQSEKAAPEQPGAAEQGDSIEPLTERAMAMMNLKGAPAAYAQVCGDKTMDELDAAELRNLIARLEALRTENTAARAGKVRTTRPEALFGE